MFNKLTSLMNSLIKRQSIKRRIISERVNLSANQIPTGHSDDNLIGTCGWVKNYKRALFSNSPTKILIISLSFPEYTPTRAFSSDLSPSTKKATWLASLISPDSVSSGILLQIAPRISVPLDCACLPGARASAFRSTLADTWIRVFGGDETLVDEIQNFG